MLHRLIRAKAVSIDKQVYMTTLKCQLKGGSTGVKKHQYIIFNPLNMSTNSFDTMNIGVWIGLETPGGNNNNNNKKVILVMQRSFYKL